MKTPQHVRQIGHLLLAQLLFTLVVSLTLFAFNSEKNAMSALLGGLVALIPSILFTKKLFAYQGARAAKHIVRSFYLGEAIKIVSTASLFVLVFIFYPINPLTFFLMYIAVIMSHWFAPLVIDSKLKRLKRD